MGCACLLGPGMNHLVGLGGGRRQGSMGLLICLFILLCMFGCCWERKRRYLFKQSLETEVILSSFLKKTRFFFPHRRPLSVLISGAVTREGSSWNCAARSGFGLKAAIPSRAGDPGPPATQSFRQSQWLTVSLYLPIVNKQPLKFFLERIAPRVSLG